MPAYVIATVDVHDAVAYAPYAERSPATIAAHGGRYLVRNGPKQLLEGQLPGARIVVLEFPSVEHAQRWYDSDAYRAIRPIRQAASRGSLYVIDGHQVPVATLA
ncbi:DUF1330 domain-containing protein [Jeongeupia naejangsanensis]|uniref:DUF1330 domain-containing protein n=1 Tax=Jeongeupia naejangsanensis TaxID=613195 RepID=A0ABS2BS89_9NEIS|nr:DUF1330 domain-containing protein [Jeongeupia naejangsanensis]MBM3117908.1 DUF1330 domain-containing protein [Jeongeupia naejangsanensis]